jgi:hypothetical protein
MGEHGVDAEPGKLGGQGGQPRGHGDTPVPRRPTQRQAPMRR